MRGLRDCKFLFLGDCSISDARNRACQDTIEEGADWLFFVDSDMDFIPDTLDRLKALDADVACTDMWARGWPSFRTVLVNSDKDEHGLITTRPVTWEESHPDGREKSGVVMDVDVCGMACTLIKRSFLERYKEHYSGAMEQPWFWTARHGEDATFCFNSKEIGATIKCDFDRVAGHWGVCRNAGQDFTRDARNQPLSVSHPDMMKRMKVRHLQSQERAV